MKKKLLRIFLFIMTLLSCIVPSENNGPRRVEAAIAISGHIYFKKPSSGWTDSKILLMVGHSTWSQGYEMTKIANTNLYYCKGPGWSDATEFAFFNTSSVWNGESNKISNRQSYATNYTSIYTNYSVNSGGYYLFVASSGNKGALLSDTYYGSLTDMANISITSKSYFSKNGNSYTSGITGGKTSIESYYYDTENSVTSSTSTSTSYSTSYSAAQYLTVETTITAIPNEGYDFVGWFKDTTTSTALSTNPTYSEVITSNTTVYARFKEKEYTISYDKGTAENGSATSQTKYYHSSITLPSLSYTKTGYTQTGWSLNSDGSTKDYELGGSFSSNSETTLYPYWTINKYTVSLNVNPTEGGTTTGSGEYEYESSVSISAIPNIGYTFYQWNDGDKTNPRTITLGAEDVTYTATFTPKTYKINFDDGDGTISTDSLSIEYNTSVGTLPSATPPSADYIHLGWYLSTNANETDNIKNDTILNANNFNITSNDTTEITLYAKYKQLEKYTVSFDSNGGSEEEDITVFQTLHYGFNAAFPTPTKIGYTFNCWNYNGEEVSLSDTIKVNANHTLTASWTPNEYTVTLSQENASTEGTTSVTATYDSAMPSISSLPTKTGYTFEGYYLDSTKYYNADGTSAHIWDIAENSTLTPNWTANTYIITFNEQKPTNSSELTSGTTSLNVTYDNSINNITPPSITGYTFNGYYTNTNGQGTKYFDSDGNSVLNSYTTPNNITLYAYWSVNKYAVTLETNGGTYKDGYTAPNHHTYDEATTLPTSDNVYKKGYNFDGWYTNKEYTGTAISVIPATTAEATTYYAKWTPITYTIKFDSNDGEGTMTSLSATYDVSQTLTENSFTRMGYTFCGWNTEANGSGTSYTNGQEVNNLTTVKDGTVTLYAQWTPITYTIILNSNNTANQNESVTATYDTTTTLSFTSFSQLGYEIVGWSTNADGTGDIYTDSLSKNLSSNQGDEITLYAVWELEQYTITYSSPEDFGTMTNNNVTTFNYLSDSITLIEPTLENYTFAGWTCDELGIAEPTKNLVIIPSEDSKDLTIIANWDQKVTVYIDMSDIYNQYYGQYKIEAPFVYYYNSEENSGTFGQQKMEIVNNNIYKYDIYFVKTNNLQNIQSIEKIIFGYYQLNLDEEYDSSNDDNYTKPQTDHIEFNVNGSNNGKEYLFYYTYDEDAILTGFKVGKTYTITVTAYSHEDASQKAKWYKYTISESTGTSGKTTFKLVIPSNWSNIGEVYFQPEGVDAGILATGSNNTYSVALDYDTYGCISAIQCNFEQDSYWWYHLYDSYHEYDTQTYTYASSYIYSIDIKDAPRINYYDGENLVHTSTFGESYQVQFVEKEGYKLEGWYTTSTLDEDTKYVGGSFATSTYNLYANYVVAHDYFIYVEAKDIGWDMDNMSVYKWSDYFTSHNNSWPGSKEDIVYLGNGMYRVFIDASKSYDYLIFCDTNTDNKNGIKDNIVQTQDILMTPTMSYYVITSETVEGTSGANYGKYLNKVYSELSLGNDMYAQKNVSNTTNNEFRFTAGLKDYEDLVEIEEGTVGKEFGYKFIFIKGDSCYVGYWNFTTNTMLDCVRYEGTLYEASKEGYKGYYSLTLTDSITFNYSDYDQIIVVACYRDTDNTTQVIKAQEYNIVGTGSNVQLYEIERE